MFARPVSCSASYSASRLGIALLLGIVGTVGTIGTAGTVGCVLSEDSIQNKIDTPPNTPPNTPPKNPPNTPPVQINNVPPVNTQPQIKDTEYTEVIRKVVSMPQNYELQSRASRVGLQVLNVMWEDTGRNMGSSVGPNISDLTLQVREKVELVDRVNSANRDANGHGIGDVADGKNNKDNNKDKENIRTHLLPVIRYPNFSDKTADISMDKLWVKVGNQHKGESVAVPLKEVLQHLNEYLSDPRSLDASGNFFTKQDSHVLVSAQHVFVPIPKAGKAEFNPVLFNYQSSEGNPAVLSLLVTREGTSATVIENRRGDQTQQSWGQQLFYNNGGQKTVFTAERREDVKARIESGNARPEDAGALEKGADMVMVIQIPLKHKQMGRGGYGGDGYATGGLGAVGTGIGGGGYADAAAAEGAKLEKQAKAAPPPTAAPVAATASPMPSEKSDVDNAIIGHGEDMGKFVEMNNLKLVRDDRFPIRVTVQFYKATSNGVISDEDLAEAKKTIDQVYAKGDYTGSLVVPENQRVTRPTDWIKGRTPTN